MAITRREFIGSGAKGMVGAGVGLGLGGGALGSLLAACGTSSSTSSGTEVIGFAYGQSGLMVPYDTPGVVLAKLAIDDFNKKGGILGHSMKTVEANTNSEIVKAATAGQEVIDKGAQLLAASEDFNFGGGTAVVANAKKLLCFSLGAGSLKFGPEGIGPYAFTMSSGSNTHAAISAEWPYNKKGWRSVYILQDTSISFQTEYTHYFIKRWSELAGASSIVGNDIFQLSAPSIAPQITRFKAASTKPDFILLVGYPPGAASAVRQLRAAGINVPIMAPSSNDGAFWLDAVPGLNDFYNICYASVFGDDPSANINALVQRYKTTTGSDITIADGFMGYAMIELWVKAAQMANSIDDTAMLNALNKFKDVPTVLGNTTFTPEIHFAIGRGMAITAVVNGKKKWVDYYTPTNVPAPEF